MDLSPWYLQQPSEPIGESWLTGEQCLVDSGPYAGRSLAELVSQFPAEILGPGGAPGEHAFPLLIKLLFPHEKLSVQVHPDDGIAQKMGEPRGKTECWYVLWAAPGASIALGLRQGTSLETVRRAVADKSLESLLEWIPVSEGDMVFVDAGTVHAIGPGVVLLETQQTSDLTFRLYDYGRPRELHLESALRALKLKTQAGKVQPVEREGCVELIRRRYFVVDRFDLKAGESRSMRNPSGVAHSWVALSGAASVQAPGSDPAPIERGQAVIVPGACAEYTLTAGDEFAGVRAMPPGAQ